METVASYDEALKNASEENMEWEEAGKEWEEGETDGLRTYVCKSCGGEIVGDDTTAATACPFCGNPVVMMEQFSGDLKPDLVIPFKVDKKAAKEALKQHYSGKKLLPKIFKDENFINEINELFCNFILRVNLLYYQKIVHCCTKIAHTMIQFPAFNKQINILWLSLNLLSQFV
jgi:DNA-directed RNA polymerase subunit RPC12/RpoP